MGKDLADKIKTVVETGSLSQLKELEVRLPSGLKDILGLSVLGPKRLPFCIKSWRQGSRGAEERRRIEQDS